MFQQDGKRKVRSEAKSQKHLSSKSVQELKTELDEIFEKEESAGVKADPELVAEYVAAIEQMGSEQNSQARSHDDFEKTWTRFTKNHPDLFPPAKAKTRSWGKQVIHIFEAAVLITVALVISAAAFNWPDHFVEWGKELLRISPAPAPCGVMELVEPNTDGYSTLAEAVAGAGMDSANTPSWIPARFSINKLAIQETPAYTVATAVYKADETDLAIRITCYLEIADVPSINFEKNDDNKKDKETRDGITYYYTENFDTLRVTWKDKNCLYSISGEISRKEIDRMVNSFYGG